MNVICGNPRVASAFTPATPSIPETSPAISSDLAARFLNRRHKVYRNIFTYSGQQFIESISIGCVNSKFIPGKTLTFSLTFSIIRLSIRLVSTGLLVSYHKYICNVQSIGSMGKSANQSCFEYFLLHQESFQDNLFQSGGSFCYFG